MPYAALLAAHWRAALDDAIEKSDERLSNFKRGTAAIGLRGFKRSYSPVLHVDLRR